MRIKVLGAAAGGGAGVARSLVADYLDVLCTRASRPFALFLALLCSNGVLYASFLPFLPIFVSEQLGLQQDFTGTFRTTPSWR